MPDERIPMVGHTIMLGDTPIEGITEASVLLDIDVTMIDATELLSDAMQSEPGLPDLGTTEFKGNWSPGSPGQAAVLAAATPASAATAFVGTLANSGATVIRTVGPIKKFKVSGGGPNTLATFECTQKVNSFTLTP